MTPQLNLQPQEWMLATWRNIEPLPLVERPFVWEEFVARYQGVLDATVKRESGKFYAERGADWKSAELTYGISREEAALWFTLMVQSNGDLPPVAKLDRLRCVTEWDEAATLWLQNRRDISDRIILPAFRLFSAERILNLFYQPVARNTASPQMEFNYFREHVWPYLSHTQRQAARQQIQRDWSQMTPPMPTKRMSRNDYYFYFYAALLGCHDELRDLLTRWPDDIFKKQSRLYNHSFHPQELILGLGSAALVEQEMARLQLRIGSPHVLAGWLAHTEARRFDLVLDSLLSSQSDGWVETMVYAFGRMAPVPATAESILATLYHVAGSKAASHWLRRNPQVAAEGLLETAQGRNKRAKQARAYLNEQLRTADVGNWIRTNAPTKLLDKLDTSVIDTVDETPDWLDAIAAHARPFAKVKWVQASDLHPILLDGKQLTQAQMSGVLQLLRVQKHELLQPLVDLHVVGSADASQFAISLVTRFAQQRRTKRDIWTFDALRLFGNDETALQLERWMREWTQRRKESWFNAGFDTLRDWPTPTGWLQLLHLQYDKLWANYRRKLRKRLSETRLASHHVLEEVADAPQLHQRELVSNRQTYTIMLSNDLQPRLRDVKGKLRDDLPKSARHHKGRVWWQLYRRFADQFLRVQTGYLEEMMVRQRRWTLEQFMILFLQHPFRSQVAQQVLWGSYQAGELLHTFRIDEEFVLVNNDEVALGHVPTEIGVVHPIEVDSAELQQWQTIFIDYHIIQPIDQLNRQTFTPTSQQAKQKTLTPKSTGFLKPTSKIRHALFSEQWELGVRHRNENLVHFYRFFDDLLAVGEVEQVENNHFRVKALYFVESMKKMPYEAPRVLFGQVAPLAFSEAVRDIIL